MPEIDPLLTNLIVGLTTGIFGYWLARGGKSVDRRQEFRAVIRKLADDADTSHSMKVYTVHDRAVPIIRSIQIEVAPELGWIRRRRFNAQCKSFLAVHKSAYIAEDSRKYQSDEERRAAWKMLGADLRDRLNAIADTI